MLRSIFIEIPDNDIKLEGIKIIAPAFATFTTLKQLDLAGKFRMFMLSCSPSNFLSVVRNVTGTNLGDEGVALLASHLPPSLSSLVLTGG